MARHRNIAMPVEYDPTGMKGEPGEGMIVERDCVHPSKVGAEPRDFFAMPRLRYYDRVDDGGGEEDE